MKIEGEVAGGGVVDESGEKSNLRESREKGEHRKVNESKTIS